MKILVPLQISGTFFFVLIYVKYQKQYHHQGVNMSIEKEKEYKCWIIA